MKKLIIILMTFASIFFFSTPGMATNSSWSLLLQTDNQNSSEKEVSLSQLEKTLCISAKCNIYKPYPAEETCLDAFDLYFEITDGEMPSCIPRYIIQDDPVPTNELWCYAIWKIYSKEGCDPLFDPALDVYGIIYESDGITPYEICLQNKLAQFDVCSLALHLRCYSDCGDPNSKCREKYIYSDPPDYEAYSECREKFYPRQEKCYKNKCIGYFYQEQPLINY